MRIAAMVPVCLLACGLWACTPRDEAPPPVAAPEEPVPRDRTFDPVSVQFHIVEEVARKPPLVELRADIVVLNHASEARWVLLPRQAGQRPLEGGGVDVLEVERWGDVVVGSWLGTGGFRAVRVGPDAHVTLQRVPIQWWRTGDEPEAWRHEDPRFPSLEALACRELVIDGQRAVTWFDSDPTTQHIRAGAAPPAIIATTRHRPDHAEVTAELLEPIEVRYVPWPRD